jgi:hypothetical protein
MMPSLDKISKKKIARNMLTKVETDVILAFLKLYPHDAFGNDGEHHHVW